MPSRSAALNGASVARRQDDIPTALESGLPFDWRKYLPVNPACAAYPELSRDELIAVGNDIRKRGLQSEIVVRRKETPCKERYHDEYELIDGRSRLDAMAAVGIKFKFERGNRGSGPFLRFLNSELCGFDGSRIKVRVVDIPEEEIEAFVRSANLHRRHLSREEQDKRTVELLKATPELSNAQIGRQSGRDDKTVAKFRRELEATSEIPRLEKTRGKDGKARPVKVIKARPARNTPPKKSPPPAISRWRKLNLDDLEAAILQEQQRSVDTPGGITPAEWSRLDKAQARKLALRAKVGGEVIVQQEAGAAELHSLIERDWSEAERAFESHATHRFLTEIVREFGRPTAPIMIRHRRAR